MQQSTHYNSAYVRLELVTLISPDCVLYLHPGKGKHGCGWVVVRALFDQLCSRPAPQLLGCLPAERATAWSPTSSTRRPTWPRRCGRDPGAT